MKESLQQLKPFDPHWDLVSSPKHMQDSPTSILNYAKEVEKIARHREVIATSLSPLHKRSVQVELEAGDLLLGSVQTKLKLLRFAQASVSK